MILAVIGDIHASHDNIKDTSLGMENLINILEDKEVRPGLTFDQVKSFFALF